jgi:tripartite-type tricarboxylate transporter receptor subunit TctC
MSTHSRAPVTAIFMIGAALALSPGGAFAQPAAEFFRGAQIKFIISTAVGGDYDQWSRLLARHMGKHLPGNPTFVPQNMPGAGQLVATNYLFNIAPRDGSVIGMIGRNLANDALVKKNGVRFDPIQFNWLGSPEVSHRVCVAMDDAPVKTAQDLFEHELMVGGAGGGTAVSATPALLAKLLGFKFKLVEGYGSSQAILLAMERGEVQGICQTFASLRSSRPGWIESGRMRILFNTESHPIPGLQAPSVFEFAKTEEQKQILGLYSSNVELGRPIVAPPGVPPDRVETLYRALAATMEDPALKAEAERQGMDIGYVSGKDLASTVAGILRTPPELVTKLEALLK